jgi:hypothetical protein
MNDFFRRFDDYMHQQVDTMLEVLESEESIRVVVSRPFEPSVDHLYRLPQCA